MQHPSLASALDELDLEIDLDRPELGATLDRHASEPVKRRERRSSTFCDIWDLVAPGEPCPTCETAYEDRLRLARNG